MLSHVYIQIQLFVGLLMLNVDMAYWLGPKRLCCSIWLYHVLYENAERKFVNRLAQLCQQHNSDNDVAAIFIIKVIAVVIVV